MTSTSHSDEALLGGLFAAQVAADIQREQEEARAAAEAQKEAQRDRVGEKLIADGYAHNEFLLDLNAAIQPADMALEYPWNLPSRMFQFPIRTERDPDGVRHMCVSHPLLMDHPLVKEMQTKGYEILPNPDDCLNDSGVPVSFYCNAQWHHAVDLITKDHRALLDTRRFTTDEAILGAVAYRCQYPHEKGSMSQMLTDMREVMAALNVPEPADFPAGMAEMFGPPTAINTDASSGKRKATRWVINTRLAYNATAEERAALTWGYIHGIEAGWFVSVKGYLHWSEKGRAEFSTLQQPVLQETEAEEEEVFEP